jgi:hypothetical protein
MPPLRVAQIVEIFIDFKGAAWLARREKHRRRSGTCGAATTR